MIHLPYSVIFNDTDFTLLELNEKESFEYDPQIQKIVRSEEWLQELKTLIESAKEVKDSFTKIIQIHYNKSKSIL